MTMDNLTCRATCRIFHKILTKSWQPDMPGTVEPYMTLRSQEPLMMVNAMKQFLDFSRIHTTIFFGFQYAHAPG